VLAPIRFNDQSGFDTGKIDEVWRDRQLPAKPKAEMVAPEEIPEPLLRVGGKPT
jgi:hypothetical protein